VDISIIVCTYKPDLRILERCLTAVSQLRKDGLTVECFLVDNNSKPAVAENSFVKEFLQKCPWARLLVEEKQGLTHARLCGFNASKGALVVFFDDDNEPDAGYLQGIREYFNNDPATGMLGPGIVNVEYTDGAGKWLIKNKHFFQHLQLTDEELAELEKNGKKQYPCGTGMVVRREVMGAYQKMISEGKLSTTDRTGKVLGGWGDSQMLWLGHQMGYHSNRTSALKTNHLINGSKANLEYLKRQSYSEAISFLPALIEFLPEEKNKYTKLNSLVIKGFFRGVRIFLFNFFRRKSLTIKMAGHLGTMQSYYLINEKKPARFTGWLKNLLKLN
jgi:glycosyltransferase involved in cell wall biosynthesis